MGRESAQAAIEQAHWGTRLVAVFGPEGFPGRRAYVARAYESFYVLIDDAGIVHAIPSEQVRELIGRESVHGHQGLLCKTWGWLCVADLRAKDIQPTAKDEIE